MLWIAVPRSRWQFQTVFVHRTNRISVRCSKNLPGISIHLAQFHSGKNQMLWRGISSRHQVSNLRGRNGIHANAFGVKVLVFSEGSWLMLPIIFLGLMVGADPVPTITSIAGTGEKGYTVDGGLASKAMLNEPFGLAFNKHGHLFFSDTGNHRVRVVMATGEIFTIAGNGKKGFAGDGGKGQDAMLNEPYGVAADADGEIIYFVDRLNYCIRK